MAEKMIDLIYITGNKLKIEAAQKAMSPLGINVIQKNIDCPEIQADTNEEIAKFSSQYASNLLHCDCVKNDSGLVINALNGFPGPYTKYVEQVLTEKGILKLMEGVEDRTCYYVDAWAYTEYGKEPVVFLAKSYGRISTELQGDFGYGYDKIFIPEGADVTLGCMSDEERLKYWCSDAHKVLAEYIKKVKN